MGRVCERFATDTFGSAVAGAGLALGHVRGTNIYIMEFIDDD